MLLLGVAFDQTTLAPWQVMYAVAYPMLSIVALCRVAKVMFTPLRHRHGREACDVTIADVECQGASGLRAQ